MEFGTPKPFTAEEKEKTKSRMKSDAELVEGGAEMSSDGSINPTEEQYEKAQSAMETELTSKKEVNEEKKEEIMKKVEVAEMKGVDFFQSSDGKVIAYSGTGSKMFLSDDGKTFYELKNRSFGGTSKEHKLSFENPHKGIQGELSRKNDIVTMNGETFTKVEAYQPTETVKLPEIRQEQYAFTLKGGEKLKVTADKYNFTYESFKLFIGEREIPIKHIERFRDGGTTIIDTDEGRLFVPADRNKKPTWNGEEITR